MSALTLAFVALAGGLGATLRFVIDGVVRARLTVGYPLATTIINVTGSLLLGLLTGMAIGHGVPARWDAIAGTGLLGGYTTFSTASFETIRLVEDRRFLAALANGLGMLVVAVVVAALGVALGRQI
jgi:CrcB protein